MNRDDDPLNAAKGIVIGTLLGCALWALGFWLFAAY